MGLERPQRLPRVRSRGQHADLGARVREEKTQQLAPGVPAGTGDRDPEVTHAA